MNLSKINFNSLEKSLLENKFDIYSDGFINFEEFLKYLNLSQLKSENRNVNNDSNCKNKN